MQEAERTEGRLAAHRHSVWCVDALTPTGKSLTRLPRGLVAVPDERVRVRPLQRLLLDKKKDQH